ncbi:MAG: glycosyltransferase family protein [Armatimonadia bacterium]
MIVAIIQARMGASRFPNKTLVPIFEHTLLGWTILAVKASRLVDRVVVATTTDANDTPVFEHAQEYGVAAFRGSENDVLDRFVQCAREFEADVIVRISGDSPLWCPWASDFVIDQQQRTGVDYASNCVHDVYPLGVQSEVFTREALEASVALADLPTDHEHATPALRRHFPRFSVLSVLAPPELERPQYRLCVDNLDDLAVVKELFERVPHEADLPPDLLAVCEELDGDEELRGRNASVVQKYKTGNDLQGKAPTVMMPLAWRETAKTENRKRKTGGNGGGNEGE